MDNLFDELDTYNKKISKEDKCCDNDNNYVFKDGIVVCKCCNNTVSNISLGAEWRYYGVSECEIV